MNEHTFTAVVGETDMTLTRPAPSFSSQPLTRDPAADQEERAHHLLTLEMHGVRPDLARAAADALDDEGLRSFGLDGYHLNLLRLFGSQWPLERVRDTARSAARERAWQDWRSKHHAVDMSSHLRIVPNVADQPELQCQFAQLAGWRDSPLPRLLAEGRGVLVACFCVGGYRYVPGEAVLLGHHVTQPSVTTGCREARQFFALMPPWLEERYRVVDIEASASGSMAVARALKRGKLVIVNIDGVTHDFGQKDERAWSVVPFAGLRVRVLNGMVRLATACGATIVPLLTPRVSPTLDRLEFGAPIRSLFLPEAAIEPFVQTTMETLYAFLGRHVLARPEEWERLSKLHEIRVPEPEPDPEIARRGADSMAARDHVDRALASGRALQLNERRIARLEHGGKAVWADAFTLRAFVIPDGLRALSDAFVAGNSVTASTVARDFPEAHLDRGAREVLTQLWMRGAVTEH